MLSSRLRMASTAGQGEIHAQHRMGLQPVGVLSQRQLGFEDFDVQPLSALVRIGIAMDASANPPGSGPAMLSWWNEASRARSDLATPAG